MIIEYINTTRTEFLKEKAIYRFLSMAMVQQLLVTDDFMFLSPSRWPDPFERAFLNARIRINNQPVTIPFSPNNGNFKIFCQCWSGNQESEAYWKIHTPNNDGIRLKIRTETLINFLEILPYEFYISKVKYLPVKQIKATNTLFLEEPSPHHNIDSLNIKLLSRKRLPYRYENEYRIFLIDRDGQPQDLKAIPNFPFCDLISNIRLSPFLSLQNAQTIRAQIHQKCMNLLVTHSRLNQGAVRFQINLKSKGSILTKSFWEYYRLRLEYFLKEHI